MDKNKKSIGKIIWTIVASILVMGASVGFFFVCAESYANKSIRGWNVVGYSFLFFALGLVYFLNGILDLIEAIKKSKTNTKQLDSDNTENALNNTEKDVSTSKIAEKNDVGVSENPQNETLTNELSFVENSKTLEQTTTQSENSSQGQNNPNSEKFENQNTKNEKVSNIKVEKKQRDKNKDKFEN